MAYDIAVVYENGIITFYYDGQFLVPNKIMEFQLILMDFMLGNHLQSKSLARSDGLLDDYAIWNIALTQEQIQDNMVK